MKPILVNFLIFFLGLLLGNRLAIFRDKRKEFNDAVVPVRLWLIKAKENPSPHAKWPREVDVDFFAQKLVWYKRRSFLKQLDSYKKLHKSKIVQDKYGSVKYSDHKEIKEALNKLFNYTKSR